MAKIKGKQIGKIILAVLRAAIVLAALICAVWINLTVYVNIANAFAVVFLAVGFAAAFPKQLWGAVKWLWKRLWGKISVCIFSSVFAVGAVTGVCFSVNMAAHSAVPLERVDCVLVLGCQVRGEIPSYMLQDRCRKAVEVLNASPYAICIVSGGRGRGESITEAEAMLRYLVACGIDEHRIIKEERATSTAENMLYSAEILRGLGKMQNVAVVTNEFHQYRAGIYAEKAGLSVGHYSAATRPKSFLNSWVREWAALLDVWI